MRHRTQPLPSLARRRISPLRALALFALAATIALIPTPDANARQNRPARQAQPSPDAVSVRAYAPQPRTILGSSIPLYIEINNATPSTNPDLTHAVDGLRIDFLRASQSSASSIEIVNGRRVQQTTHTTSLQYTITPLRAGRFVIPPIPITIDNREYTTNPITLEANGAEQREDLRATIDLEHSSVYHGQPLAIALHIDAVPPLTAIPSILSPPTVNGMEFHPMPTGMTSPDPDAPTLRTHEDQISITQPMTNRSSPAIGSLFDQPANLKRSQTTLDELQAQRWTMRAIAIPTTTGAITIPPITVRVQYETITGRDVFGRSITDTHTVLLETQPLTLQSIPLPPDPAPLNALPWDRPGTTPLVGRFSIAARATPPTVNVGDPIELTVAITGWPPLARLGRLDLSRDPELTRRFRLTTEPAPPNTSPSNITFSTQLRAADERVNAIPPIQLRAFDPAAAEWRTIASDPIPLQVRATRVVRAGDVIDPQSLTATTTLQATSDPNTFAPIAIDPAILTQRACTLASVIASPIAWTALAAPPAACLLSAAAIAAIRRRAKQPTAISPKAAAARVRSAIAALAARTPPTAPLTDTALNLTTILREYLAATSTHHPPPNAITQLLETCDAIRFGGHAATTHDQLLVQATHALDSASPTSRPTHP